jgi:hypothetical protein
VLPVAEAERPADNQGPISTNHEKPRLLFSPRQRLEAKTELVTGEHTVSFLNSCHLCRI